MSAAPEPPEGGDSLLTVRIQVCLNCLRKEPGECHAPGCFYWMQNVSAVDERLALYVVPTSAGSA